MNFNWNHRQLKAWFSRLPAAQRIGSWTVLAFPSSAEWTTLVDVLVPICARMLTWLTWWDLYWTSKLRHPVATRPCWFSTFTLAFRVTRSRSQPLADSVWFHVIRYIGMGVNMLIWRRLALNTSFVVVLPSCWCFGMLDGDGGLYRPPLLVLALVSEVRCMSMCTTYSMTGKAI